MADMGIPHHTKATLEFCLDIGIHFSEALFHLWQILERVISGFSLAFLLDRGGLLTCTLLFGADPGVVFHIGSSSVQDDARILEPGYPKAITWKEFKQQHPDWDFGEKDPDRYDFEAKAKNAWKKVGPRFCEGFGIPFEEYGEQSSLASLSRHFLFILDASSSMVGCQKWGAVVQALKTVANQDKLFGLDSRFSVILFSNDAELVVCDCAASELLERDFDPPYHGTNFAAAFQRAANFVEDEDFAGRRPMVVFMTDGQDCHRGEAIWFGEGLAASREEAVLDLVCQFAKKQQDWEFRAISFGLGADLKLLKEICEYIEKADEGDGRAKSSECIEAADDMDLVQVCALSMAAAHLL